MALPIERYESGFPKDVQRTKFNMGINERLKNARAKKKMSLSDVVVQLKVKYDIKTGRSTIQGYEAPEDNQNHRYPSVHMLNALASLYDCSIDYLFGYSADLKRPTNDIKTLLELYTDLEWNGEPLTAGQKGMIIEMTEKIMDIKPEVN